MNRKGRRAARSRRRRMRGRGAAFVLRGVSSLEELGAEGARLLAALELVGIGLVLMGPEKNDEGTKIELDSAS